MLCTVLPVGTRSLRYTRAMQEPIFRAFEINASILPGHNLFSLFLHLCQGIRNTRVP